MTKQMGVCIFIFLDETTLPSPHLRGVDISAEVSTIAQTVVT